MQLFQTAGGVPSPHIVEHEHGVQTAGHGQIEDLQLAVLGVLGLIFLVGQGNFFFSMYARVPMRMRLLSHHAEKPRPRWTSRSLTG